MEEETEIKTEKDYDPLKTLKDIADWQKEGSKVKLPSVQRGFVWKPHQVEDLWDSILRKYPIGTFLLSKTTTANTYDLMDGQQRALSIFFGFFDPYDEKNAKINFHSIKGNPNPSEYLVVWIDICPNEEQEEKEKEDEPEKIKFLIRCTTRWHPWGYQTQKNNERLSLSDRRKALEILKKNPKNEKCRYTSFKNTETFPYDACCPLPLAFFTGSKDVPEVIDKTHKLPDNFCTKHSYDKFTDKEDFIKKLETDGYELNKKIRKIFNLVKDTLCSRRIYCEKIDNNISKEEKIEIFERINKYGTKLTDDDLIYSTYKVTFEEEINKNEYKEEETITKKVENVGMSFIAPTDIISLVSRITSFELEENKKYPSKMNLSEFQQKIRNNEDFKNRMLQMIKENEAEKLFKNAIDILKCKDNFLFKGKIPPVLIKQFVKNSEDLFLFFVCWLHQSQKQSFFLSLTEKETKKLHLKIVAKLLSFDWFLKLDKQYRSTVMPKLVKRLFGEINEEKFWDKLLSEYKRTDNTDNGIHLLVKPALLKQYYEQKEIKELFLKSNPDRWKLSKEGVGTEIYEKYYKDFGEDKANESFEYFISSIIHNKSLILFAQRDYINEQFEDYNQMEDLEDTNVPWDNDHIYPKKWMDGRKYNVPEIIKDWIDTAGNFRVLSLEENRSTQDRSPQEKLIDEDVRKKSFIKDKTNDENGSFYKDWEYWQKIEKPKKSSEKNEDDKTIIHFEAVTKRMINIYTKFWTDLKINELFDTQTTEQLNKK